MSDSCAPAYKTGDLVIIQENVPSTDYSVGDAILYSPPDYEEIIIHRIFDIKVINGTHYFAIKGDSNPQPDVISPQGETFNMVLENVSVNWDDFYPGQEHPTTELVVSYFPADLVVRGKVVAGFPFVGWPLVPFNSPLPEPLGLLPLSFFSVFALYFIILAAVGLLLLVRQANEKLQELLTYIRLSDIFHKRQIRISLPAFYQFVILPLLLFELASFSLIPQPVVYTDNLTLEQSSFVPGEVPYWDLHYKQVKRINSFEITHNNRSEIRIQLWNNSNLLMTNFSQNDYNTGMNEALGTSLFIESRSFSTQQVVDPDNTFVISSTNESDPLRHKYYEYLLPLEQFRKETPPGLMTHNLYLKVETSTVDWQETFRTHMSFSFTQDLIKVEWELEAHFSRSTGFLLSQTIRQQESLWVIPEMVGMVVLAVAVSLLYEYAKRSLQILFDERQEMLLEAQKQRSLRVDVVVASSVEGGEESNGEEGDGSAGGGEIEDPGDLS